MSDSSDTSTASPTDLLALGRRHLAVGDYSGAAGTFAEACETLAKEHGDTADQCAEAYLWYGKALLGLSREESRVLGDGVPGSNNADAEEEHNTEEGGETENGEAEAEVEAEAEPKAEGEPKVEAEPEKEKVNGNVEKIEAESTTKEDEPGTSTAAEENEESEPANGDDQDESVLNVDAEGEDEVDNLQLAWEMLDLARSILYRRVQDTGENAARALLADAHLGLGEVALESETYDKAVIDMQSCLDLQKEVYGSDDRRIAETHYQIGLANSLASNFEDAITHFKNAANILETRIKTLENPAAVADDAIVKKYASLDPTYSIKSEIKELKDLLPEIQEKIQDMMDYKTETIKRVRETLCSTNGEGSSAFSSSSNTNGAGSSSASSSSSAPKPAASDISHLIKRKRKSSEGEADSSAAKRVNT